MLKNTLPQYIEISEEVLAGINNKKPVVALESSVISQGLPYPDNLNTAIKLEEIARNKGVIPATTGLIKGKIKIGLNNDEIEKLATLKDVFKVSKRDITSVIVKSGYGGTTVAATAFIASLAGIKVFATGGIGGVHCKGEKNLDISADLNEIAKNNIIIVSAGPKSIIDIGLTLEYLETLSIPVIGYRTEICPHFFLKSSKYPVSIRVDSPEEIAGIMKTGEYLDITGGILVVNPLKEELCLDNNEFEESFKIADKEAKEKNISGKRLTPFLLEKLNILTEGKTKKANLALLEGNVGLASDIAIEYNKL